MLAQVGLTMDFDMNRKPHRLSTNVIFQLAEAANNENFFHAINYTSQIMYALFQFHKLNFKPQTILTKTIFLLLINLKDPLSIYPNHAYA